MVLLERMAKSMKSPRTKTRVSKMRWRGQKMEISRNRMRMKRKMELMEMLRSSEWFWNLSMNRMHKQLHRNLNLVSFD